MRRARFNLAERIAERLIREVVSDRIYQDNGYVGQGERHAARSNSARANSPPRWQAATSRGQVLGSGWRTIVMQSYHGWPEPASISHQRQQFVYCASMMVGIPEAADRCATAV